MKTEQEILEKFESILDGHADDGDDYIEGVINALGWVLGRYDDPTEE